MSFEQLKLGNQICFPLYAASRLTIRQYEPLLTPLGLTYPQYLVMMVLWEHGEQTVGAISERLLLNTNTLTPLLKRLEEQKFVIRRRDDKDERRVFVSLTEKGKELENKAAHIPETLVNNLQNSMMPESLLELKQLLESFIQQMIKVDPRRQ